MLISEPASLASWQYWIYSCFHQYGDVSTIIAHVFHFAGLAKLLSMFSQLVTFKVYYIGIQNIIQLYDVILWFLPFRQPLLSPTFDFSAGSVICSVEAS